MVKSAQQAAEEPFLHLVRELVWTYQSMNSCSNQNIRSLGLTPSQFDVIATLGNTPGMTLTELARKTLIIKSSLTGVVDRLVKANLVERRVPDQDRRCFVAVLTPAGEEVFHRVFPAHISYMKDFFAPLSEEEMRKVCHSLEVVRALFEQPSIASECTEDHG